MPGSNGIKVLWVTGKCQAHYSHAGSRAGAPGPSRGCPTLYGMLLLSIDIQNVIG